MAEGQHTSIPEPASGLSATAQQILGVLREQSRPLDSITLSSLTRVPMEEILRAVRELAEAGLVQRVDPEPVHERFAVPA